MKKEHQVIINRLSNYLKDNPDIRFGQALYNLSINEFADKTNPETKDFLLRDIYNDSDKKILNRMI
jgi:hypothetical protein